MNFFQKLMEFIPTEEVENNAGTRRYSQCIGNKSFTREVFKTDNWYDESYQKSKFLTVFRNSRHCELFRELMGSEQENLAHLIPHEKNAEPEKFPMCYKKDSAGTLHIPTAPGTMTYEITMTCKKATPETEQLLRKMGMVEDPTCDQKINDFEKVRLWDF